MNLVVSLRPDQILVLGVLRISDYRDSCPEGVPAEIIDDLVHDYLALVVALMLYVFDHHWRLRVPLAAHQNRTVAPVYVPHSVQQDLREHGPIRPMVTILVPVALSLSLRA